MAVSQDRTRAGSSRESHARCFSSQVLHTRDPEALGDTVEKGLVLGRAAGKAPRLASGARGAEAGAGGLHSRARETQVPG